MKKHPYRILRTKQDLRCYRIEKEAFDILIKEGRI